MDKNETIARISQLRTRANLSARALSLNVGLSPCYINRLETSREFLPSLEVLYAIIDACHSTPEEFFYRDFFNYQRDQEIINLLAQVSDEKKNSILSLLKAK